MTSYGNIRMGLIELVASDLRAKARWCYGEDGRRAVMRTLLTDGTPAMILYRLMQASKRARLWPFEMFFNKLNTVLCNCIIGRGAEFGPALVFIHATGIVINGQVRGGRGVHLEHQVTIGAERRESPELGDDVFVGSGARILGPIRVGAGARVGANAVVVRDVPPHTTVVGVPARVVRTRNEADAGERTDSGAS